MFLLCHLCAPRMQDRPAGTTWDTPSRSAPKTTDLAWVVCFVPGTKFRERILRDLPLRYNANNGT